MPAQIAPKSLIILCALAMPALVGCGVGDARTVAVAGIAEPVEVDGIRPGTADLYARYVGTASLEAVATAAARAKVAGQVVEILAEEGERVKKGQPLARLDGDRLRLQVRKVRAQLSQQENELARARSLATRGLVSQAALESLEFSVADLTAAWQMLQLELDYAVIRAPISGTIAARDVQLGQQLAENTVAFQITDTEQLLTELRIPQTELHRFSRGQPVTVVPDALGELSFAATVDRISPTIDAESGTFRLTSYIDNADGKLAPGMFARVAIAYQKHENAMVLPASAIRSEDGTQVVYVIADGVTERRVIGTGIRQDEQVEVTSGLAFDEQVFRSATEGLLYGNRIVAVSVAGSTIGG